MTDNEIKKALECCRTNLIDDCKRCSLRLEDGTAQPFCATTLIGNALDLINRLQAENERLKEKNTVVLLIPENTKFENLEHFETRQISKDMLPAIVRRAKAEAYKECIKKVKEEIAEALKSNYRAIKGRIAYYEKEGDMFVGDEFVDYCNGKVDCLRGLDDFLDNLLKELVGDNNG